MLIGLTGKYCAGKNYIASLLEKRGFPVLDVDKLGYKALESEKKAVYTQFGEDLRRPDGSIDRKLLGKKVFGNQEKLAALENIVHPAANRLTEEWLAEKAALSPSSVPVINAALLHRSSLFNRFDHIIIVKAPFFTRLLRARRRDKLPWLAIIRRFTSQKGFDSKYLSKNAEIHIVENYKKGQSSNLERQIDAILEGIK